MQKKSVDLEVNQAAPAITPEQLSKLKKEDMKQAVVERFRVSGGQAQPHPAARHGMRSSDWLPADEEC